MPFATSNNLVGNRSSKAVCTGIFVILFFSFYFFDFMGRVYPAEIVLSVIAVAAFLAGRHRKQYLPRWFLASLMLWVLGTILSDLINGSSTADIMRGMARVAFFGLNVYGLISLIGGRRAVIYIGWLGLSFSGMVAFLLAPNAASLDQPWKFAFGLPTTIIVILWLTQSGRESKLTIPLLLVLAAIHFAAGARGLAIMTLVSSVVLAARIPKRWNPDRAMRVPIRPVILSISSIAVIVWLVEIYDNLALKGSFGFNAQQKAFYQSTGDFGSIVSSRSEFLLSVLSIGDNPVFGGGSYSVASDAVVSEVSSIFSELGYENIAHRLLIEVPPYHSVLLGQWAENGILSAILWVGVLAIFTKGLLLVMYRKCREPVLVCFISILGIWDLFFSPFGADRRMWLALTIATVYILTRPKRDEPRIDIYNYN